MTEQTNVLEKLIKALEEAAELAPKANVGIDVSKIRFNCRQAKKKLAALQAKEAKASEEVSTGEDAEVTESGNSDGQGDPEPTDAVPETDGSEPTDQA